MTEQKQEDFSDYIQATDVSTRVSGPLVVEAKPTLLPDQFHVSLIEIINCSPDTPQSQTKMLGLSFVLTSSVTVTNTVSNTQSLSAGLEATFGHVGKASLNVSFSKTVSLTNTDVQTFQETITDQDQVPVTVPPMTRAKVLFESTEGGIEATFKGRVVVDGSVEPNLDHFAKASDLLTEEARTIPISGILRVAAASQSKLVRMTDAKLTAEECKGEPFLSSREFTEVLLEDGKSSVFDLKSIGRALNEE